MRRSYFMLGTVLLAAGLFSTDCAWFRRIATRPALKVPPKPVERAGVRAWAVRRGAIPTQGPRAQARPGDLALSDGDIVIVVANAERGGRWLDAARTADQGYDYLGRLEPLLRVPGGSRPFELNLDSVEIAAGDSQAPPAILARGRFRPNPKISFETRYEIAPASDTVVVTTHLRNGSTQTLPLLALADRVWWGADNVFIPRTGNTHHPVQGSPFCPWLCLWQDDFSLGMMARQGSMRVFFEKDNAVVVYREAPLAAGGEVTYRRYFPVRDRRIGAVTEYAFRLRGQPVGWLEGQVLEVGTGRPVPDCRVEILTGSRQPDQTRSQPLTWVYTSEKGRFRVALPAGRYFAMTHRAVGREAPTIGFSSDVTAGKTTQIPQPLRVTPKVMVHYEVRDADTGELLPCKLRFRPYPGWRPVDFGPEWKGPGARDVYYSATGRGEINLSSGRYMVSVSRGIEYENVQVKELDVRYGGENQLKVRLKRLVQLDDFISVDMGVRTAASPGCRVSARDRVVAAAAEGVQCLVSGDVGVVTDLSKAIEEAGLSKWVKAICGRRVVWSGPKSRGHAAAGGQLLVFPCKPGSVDPAQLRREERAQSPGRLIEVLRQAYPGSLIMACRPMDKESGFVATQGYSLSSTKPYLPAGKGSVVPAGMKFDLYEAFPTGIQMFIVERVFRRMYARLLREVRNYGPAGGSDSRYLWGNECGYPRTYVFLQKEKQAGLFGQMRESLLRGHVLLTNGPFIRLLVNGRPPGSFITDKDGSVDVLFEVKAAGWVDVRAAIVFDGEFFAKHFILPPNRQLLRLPRNELASPEFPLAIKHDVIITATAAGQRSLSPVVVRDDRLGFMAFPYAMTGPIFVDADGDGKCTPPSPYKKTIGTEEF